MLTRRLLLTGAATGLAGLAAGQAFAAGALKVNLTDAEWKKRLTPSQFAVLRQEATEPPGSSPLNKEHRKGVFSCAGCSNVLYDSKTKFESGTGWPSFYQPIASSGAVTTKLDRSMGMMRTAVECASCGGHLGHMFPDGPKPTGLRYCMNGVAMTFKAA